MAKSKSVARISINKLAEYMTATSLRRKRILEDQKYPKTFIVSRYEEAQDALVEFFTDKTLNDKLIIDSIERIGKSLPKTAFESSKKVNCLEALEAFYEYSNIFDDLVDFKRDSGLTSNPRFTIKGVQVSIRPEIRLEFEIKGIKNIGALKFAFSKTNSLEKAEGEYIATILKEYLEHYNYKATKVSNKNCFVLDIFTGRVFTPPTAYKRKKNDIEAACEEILARWDSI